MLFTERRHKNSTLQIRGKQRAGKRKKTNFSDLLFRGVFHLAELPFRNYIKEVWEVARNYRRLNLNLEQAAFILKSTLIPFSRLRPPLTTKIRFNISNDKQKMCSSWLKINNYLSLTVNFVLLRKLLAVTRQKYVLNRLNWWL